MVGRLLWEQEYVGSIPTIPTSRETGENCIHRC